MVKYFFQPNVNEELSYAQITGVSQTLLRQAPPGTTPPFILAYNASTVPIAADGAREQVAVGDTDLRPRATPSSARAWRPLQGAALPYPYGGKQRQVQVDIDPAALRSKGLSAADVSNAIGTQNLIIPAGTEKIGDIEYNVKLNSSPLKAEELNDVPIRNVNGTVVFVRDVANVHDGASPQTNLVRVGGQHAVLMSVLKTGSASTLAVIDQHQAAAAGHPCARLPEALQVDLTRRSVAVRARRGQRRGSRGRDRGRADRAHDPAVPGLAGAAR